MSAVLLEPHYLPSLEYFTILAQADEIRWDQQSPFQKQTYRNRAHILTANGPQALIVPVHYKMGMPLREVTIDNGQSWARVHWGAIYSAYGKAPFFDYFQDIFQDILHKQHKHLIDLNLEMMEASMKLLGWKKTIVISTDTNGAIDLRNDILAKKSWESRHYYRPTTYFQNFGKAFVPNLSILDLLFCQGPEAGEILNHSIQAPIERF